MRMLEGMRASMSDIVRRGGSDRRGVLVKAVFTRALAADAAGRNHRPRQWAGLRRRTTMKPIGGTGVAFGAFIVEWRDAVPARAGLAVGKRRCAR